MHYQCMAPSRWKRSLIQCLLRRALKVSSSFTSFMDEVNRVKRTLANNAYPEAVIDKCISEFMNHHNIDEMNFKTHPPDLSKKSLDEKIEYILIPYLGKPSLRFQRRLRRSFQDMGINIRTAYSTTKVAEYFSLKTRTGALFKSNVVYKFSCACDKSISYIGESRRQLFARISEHTVDTKNSAVFNHIYNCGSCQDADNIANQFEILLNCTPFNILSAEAMMIAKYSPNLNTQLGPNVGAAVSLTLYR